MGLRAANTEEFEIVKEMVSSLIKDSVYDNLLETFVLTEDVYQTFMGPKNHEERIMLFSLNEEDEITGLGVFEKLTFGYVNIPVARVVAMYVKPEYRKKGYLKELKKAFEHWGKAVGCTYYNINVSTGADLAKDGYKVYEVVYMKEVK